MNTIVSLHHFMLDKECQEKWGWRLEWRSRYFCSLLAGEKLEAISGSLRELKQNFGKRGLTLVSIFLVNLNPFIEGIKCNFCYLVFFKLILPWFYEIIKPGQNPSGTEMDIVPDYCYWENIRFFWSWKSHHLSIALLLTFLSIPSPLTCHSKSSSFLKWNFIPYCLLSFLFSISAVNN